MKQFIYLLRSSKVLDELVDREAVRSVDITVPTTNRSKSEGGRDGTGGHIECV